MDAAVAGHLDLVSRRERLVLDQVGGHGETEAHRLLPAENVIEDLVGTSNFKPAHLRRLLNEAGLVPDVNQIQLNPLVSRPAARAFHAAHGVLTQSWAPLGGGDVDALTVPLVAELAAAHGRTPPQIVLRWHVQQGLVPIPKSSDPQRLRSNLDVFGFALSDAEMADLSALDRGELAAVDSDESFTDSPSAGALCPARRTPGAQPHERPRAAERSHTVASA